MVTLFESDLKLARGLVIKLYKRNGALYGGSAAGHAHQTSGFVHVAAQAHVHEWEPLGMTSERRLVSDGRQDWCVTIKLAVHNCKCGAISKTEVSRA